MEQADKLGANTKLAKECIEQEIENGAIKMANLAQGNSQ